jgi:hypothetical protein
MEMDVRGGVGVSLGLNHTEKKWPQNWNLRDVTGVIGDKGGGEDDN